MSFQQMIAKAMSKGGVYIGRKGASRQAIANFIFANSKKTPGAMFNAHLRRALATMMKNGLLTAGETKQRFKRGKAPAKPKKKKAAKKKKPKKKTKKKPKKKSVKKKKKPAKKKAKKQTKKKKPAKKKQTKKKAKKKPAKKKSVKKKKSAKKKKR